MTAVFRNPLSATRIPRSVSFSSGSPGRFGALIALKAVADIVLFKILQNASNQIATRGTGESDVRDFVNFACAVVDNCKGFSIGIGICWGNHGGDSDVKLSNGGVHIPVLVNRLWGVSAQIGQRGCLRESHACDY